MPPGNSANPLQRILLAGQAGEAAPSESKSFNEPPRGTETILLAEDHEGLRNTAQEMLQKLGYQVIVAADGRESLDLFQANREHIDLVVLDVVMPGLSGPEAYLKMCDQRPDTRVIFTTGYTPKAKELMFVIEKGASILTKPYTLISLSRMIRGASEQPVTSRSTVSVG